MDVSAVIAIIGGIALLVGVFGGGVQLKELTIPPINSAFRIISFVLGVILIIAAVIVSKPEFLSLIPAQPSGSVNGPSIDPTKPLLSDTFDNKAYDGKYNTDLWNCSACVLGNVVANQGDSLMRVELNNGGEGLTSQSSWQLQHINYLQGKMNLQMTDAVGGFVYMGLGIPGQWHTWCWIMGNQNPTGKVIYACDVFTSISGQNRGDFSTESYPIDYDKWYTTKIEVAPDTYEIRFYLDDKLIGKYTPSNVTELSSTFVKVFIGASAEKPTIGFFDDVIVQPAK